MKGLEQLPRGIRAPGTDGSLKDYDEAVARQKGEKSGVKRRPPSPMVSQPPMAEFLGGSPHIPDSRGLRDPSEVPTSPALDRAIQASKAMDHARTQEEAEQIAAEWRKEKEILKKKK